MPESSARIALRAFHCTAAPQCNETAAMDRPLCCGPARKEGPPLGVEKALFPLQKGLQISTSHTTPPLFLVSNRAENCPFETLGASFFYLKAGSKSAHLQPRRSPSITSNWWPVILRVGRPREKATCELHKCVQYTHLQPTRRRPEGCAREGERQKQIKVCQKLAHCVLVSLCLNLCLCLSVSASICLCERP